MSNPFDQFDAPARNPFDGFDGSASGPKMVPGEPAPRVSADAPVPIVPTGSRPTSQLLGFIKGIADPTKKLQGLDPARAIAGMADPQLAQGLDRQNAMGRQALTNAEQQQRPGLVGQVAGGMALTAPALAMGPIAGGLVTGAALSDKTDLGGIASDTVLGGVGGKVGQTAVGGAGKLIAPKVSAAVRSLMDRGVSLTPGQALGGMAKTLEDKATSFPVIGDMIQSARSRGLEDWNKSIFNDVLAPIGEKLDKGVKAGHEAFDHAYEKIGDAYDKVIPHTITALDQDFSQHVQQAVAPIVSSLTKDGQAHFADLFKQHVLDRFAAGPLKGDMVKTVTSDLGTLAKDFQNSATRSERAIGDALAAVQSGLRETTARQNPMAAGVLRQVDQSYAMLAGLRKAASSTAADHGVFTGKQLQMASRAADGSVGKNATARGKARYQDIAQTAQDVLPSKVPDSGTPGRALIAAIPALLAGGTAAVNPWVGAAGLAATLPYTKVGQQALRGVLSPGPVRQATGGILGMLANPAGSMAALLTAQGSHQ